MSNDERPAYTPQQPTPPTLHVSFDVSRRWPQTPSLAPKNLESLLEHEINGDALPGDPA